MYDVKTFNAISKLGLEKFQQDPDYQINKSENPDAYIVRAVNLHQAKFPANLKVIGRAGVGFNNLPLTKLAHLGVVAYNTPGSNHNAVKELVIALLIATTRHLFQAIQYTSQHATGDISLDPKSDAEFHGTEIKGKKLGVIGVGHVGSAVANAAANLGMHVYAFDPYLTPDFAWKLLPNVKRVKTVDEAIKGMDYVTVHIPKNKANLHFIDADKVAELKPGAYLFNYSRLGIVDNHAVEKALDAHKIKFYATDFGDQSLAKYNGKNVYITPHIGGSTVEGEGNGAIMAAHKIMTYLNTGNVEGALNCPDLTVPFKAADRITILADPNSKILAKINTILHHPAEIHQAHDQLTAYVIVDVAKQPDPKQLQKLQALTGVRRVRVLHQKR